MTTRGYAIIFGACILGLLGLGLPDAHAAGSAPGKVTAGAGDAPHAREDQAPIEVGLDADQLGRASYLGARVDIPIVSNLSLSPELALLRVAPRTADDRPITRLFFGLGTTIHPAETWSLELSGMYGPKAFDIETVEGAIAIGHEIGADWEHDVPPRAELQLELGVGRFRWADGLGPAGANLVQVMIEAKELWRVTHYFHLTPQGMFFVYDKSLRQAVGDRLGSAMALARVGAYAPPLGLVGVRAAYVVAPWVTPFLEVDEIVYAASSGDGTELLAGVTLRLGAKASWGLGGGVLLNRANGPLVPDELANRPLPLATTDLKLGF